jgi:hypothetical protein
MIDCGHDLEFELFPDPDATAREAAGMLETARLPDRLGVGNLPLRPPAAPAKAAATPSPSSYTGGTYGRQRLPRH